MEQARAFWSGHYQVISLENNNHPWYTSWCKSQSDSRLDQHCLSWEGTDSLSKKKMSRWTHFATCWGYNPVCEVTPVILRGVVSPETWSSFWAVTDSVPKKIRIGRIYPIRIHTNNSWYQSQSDSRRDSLPRVGRD